jgi:DNA-binding transcriptional ArsR family regulator
MKRYVNRNGRRIEVETLEPKTAPRRRNEPHMGAPLTWIARVFSVVQSKGQLLVALWLYRRRSICKSDLFSVPNGELGERFGIERSTKYRALRRLEKAGAIAIVRDGKSAIRVRILW